MPSFQGGGYIDEPESRRTDEKRILNCPSPLGPVPLHGACEAMPVTEGDIGATWRLNSRRWSRLRAGKGFRLRGRYSLGPRQRGRTDRRAGNRCPRPWRGPAIARCQDAPPSGYQTKGMHNVTRLAGQVKILLCDGTALVAAYQRLEQGRLAWPAVREGVIRLSQAQFEALFEVLDWIRLWSRRVRLASAAQ